MDFYQTKKTNTDLWFLAGIVLLAFGLKIFYTQSGNGEPQLVLYPVSKIVAFFTGAGYEYQAKTGYFFPSLDILIDRSCAGVNFFIMTFCMVAISSLPFYRYWKSKLLILFGCLVLTYLLTLLATSSRILIAINSSYFSGDFPLLGTAKMHLAQGVFVYLFFLILFYFTANFFNQKISKTHA